jgi:hypothetical protein
VPDVVAVALAGAVLAQQTTTTEVRRIVGDPLPPWVVLGSGLLLGVVILVAGWVAKRRIARSG